MPDPAPPGVLRALPLVRGNGIGRILCVALGAAPLAPSPGVGSGGVPLHPPARGACPWVPCEPPWPLRPDPRAIPCCESRAPGGAGHNSGDPRHAPPPPARPHLLPLWGGDGTPCPTLGANVGHPRAGRKMVWGLSALRAACGHVCTRTEGVRVCARVCTLGGCVCVHPVQGGVRACVCVRGAGCVRVPVALRACAAGSACACGCTCVCTPACARARSECAQGAATAHGVRAGVLSAVPLPAHPCVHGVCVTRVHACR